MSVRLAFYNWLRSNLTPMRSRLPRSACVALVLIATSVRASDLKPSIILCWRVSNIACGDDGICIADRIIDHAPITFNLKAGRYSSAQGRGRIVQQLELPDGRYSVRMGTPPALREFIFSDDWLSASTRSSFGYSCKVEKQ